MENAEEVVLSFGDFDYIPVRQQLFQSGRFIRLGSRALLVLDLLLQRPGELVTKEELLASVWPIGDVGETNLRVHIGALRKVLGRNTLGRSYIANVSGRGYRFSERVTRGKRATQSVARPQEENLAKGQLVGRQDALAAIMSRRELTRLITLIGPEGVGKSSLARSVEQAKARMQGLRSVYVDVGSMAAPGDLTAAISKAGLQEAPASIQLDNCDRMIEPVADLARSLLQNNGNRLLVTSREALRIDGEWIYRVAPLDYPEEDESSSLDATLRYSAPQLLVDRLRANGDERSFTDDDVAHLIEICRRVDGVPLLLGVAAAQGSVLSLAQLAQSDIAQFRLPRREGERGGQRRTFGDRMERTWRDYTPSEKTLLQSLSVFPAWFDLAGAIKVAGLDDALSAEFADIVSRSDLIVDMRADGARYKLPATMRSLASGSLVASGRQDAVHLRLVDLTMRSFTRSPGGIQDGHEQWLSRCRGGMDNLRACLEWSVGQARNPTAGLDLLAAALPACLLLSRLTECRPYLQPSLQHLRSSHPERHAQASDLEIALALCLYYDRGFTTALLLRLQSALTSARSADIVPQQLSILWMLFGTLGNEGEYEAAFEYAAAFEQTSNAAEDPNLQAYSRRMMGRACHDLGRHSQALQHLGESLKMPVSRQSIRLYAYEVDHVTAVLAARARALWVSGAIDDATEITQQCLARGALTQHEQTMAWALVFHLCPVAFWNGNSELTRSFVAMALSQTEKAFQPWSEWARLHALALDVATDVAKADDFRAGFGRLNRAQEDMFATFLPQLVSPRLQWQSVLDCSSWAQPELMRAIVERDFAAPVEMQEQRLLQAERLALQQGAASWRLRCAMSLASRLHRSGRSAAAIAVLEPAYAAMQQGRNIPEMRDAAQFLQSL